jgi:hypothetical protein
MISASFAPLVALVLARLAGASNLTAAKAALVVAVLLLTVHGWLAGRAAQLRNWQLFFATSFAAALGLVMILLQGPRADPPALNAGSGRRRDGYETRPPSASGAAVLATADSRGALVFSARAPLRRS